MSLRIALILALGGALGTLGRYGLSLLTLPISQGTPWGTILINMVGLCGGFTTFSSFSLQTLDLLRSGHTGRALLNVTASVVLCVGAVALGHLLASHLNGGDPRIAQIEGEELT